MKFTLTLDEAKRILRSHLSIANDVELVITNLRKIKMDAPKTSRPLSELLLAALNPTSDGFHCLYYDGIHYNIKPEHKIAAIRAIRTLFYNQGVSCGLAEAKKFSEHFPTFLQELDKPGWTVERMFQNLC